MASGFNNTPPASEFHRHSSWGRTRSPKNILSKSRAGINADGDHLAVNGTSSDYITENQRFLIVQIKVWDTSFKVQGYMHASGEWADISGATASAAGIHKFEIAGIDKVRFVTGGATQLFAACSTF
jgi:hypothetical protein